MQYQIVKQLKYNSVFNRLQETFDRVRHQREEEVRNLKEHSEQLEENRKDLENRMKRFEIGGHIFVIPLQYQTAYFYRCKCYNEDKFY